AEPRLGLRTALLPCRVGGAGESRLDGFPATVREVRTKPPPQIDRLTYVERTVIRVLQHVNAWCRGRSAADAFARAAPLLASILDDQRLRDEPLRELGRRAADAEHLCRQPLMIDGVAHRSDASEKAIPKKDGSSHQSPV